MRICKAIPLAAPILVGAAAILSAPTAGADTPGVYATATSPGFFNRSGWYMGLDVGGAFNPGLNNWNGNGFTSDVVGHVNTLVSEKGNSETVTGGIYGGYDWKFQDLPLAMAIEADFSGLGDIQRNHSATYAYDGVGLAPAGTYRFDSGRGTNWYGTVRGNLGYVPNGQAEFYITGGFAYAGNGGAGNSAVYYTNPVTGVTTGYKGSGNGNSQTGYAAGGGFSYAFMENLAVRVEGMYVDLGQHDHTYYFPGGAYTIDEHFNFHFTVVRAGLTYKF